jgi:hypothetical protein
VQHVVEARALVHQRERLLDQGLEQLGSLAQRLAHAVGAEDRRPVTRQQPLGAERLHRA